MTWKAEDVAQDTLHSLGNILALYDISPDFDLPPYLKHIRPELERLANQLAETDFSPKSAWKLVQGKGGAKRSPKQVAHRRKHLVQYRNSGHS